VGKFTGYIFNFYKKEFCCINVYSVLACLVFLCLRGLFIQVIKSRRMRWMGQAYEWRKTEMHKGFLAVGGGGRHEGRGPLGRHRNRWILTVIVWEGQVVG
jgi:hypothetical protein